ncbi:hypothetical protein V2J09_015439 [Rumex salicifolius]
MQKFPFEAAHRTVVKSYRSLDFDTGSHVGGEMDSASWRMSRIGGHLIPTNILDTGSVKFSSTSSSDSTKDRVQRIHGQVSTLPVSWKIVRHESGNDFTDIIYEKAVGEGIAKITINRPERRNAFRPRTIKELIWAFNDAREDLTIGVIILAGQGSKAFCSGGDQTATAEDGSLNLVDLQAQIRRLPKPVIAMVSGFAVGGGHVLHMICDITIAADNAIFGQAGPKIGPKRTKEMWFLTRLYPASEAEKMGLVNTVVPLEKLEEETVKWSREILRNSPTAIRVLKSAINAVDDGHAGLQELGANACLVYYETEEGSEGKKAFIEKRPPNFSKFPRLP